MILTDVHGIARTVTEVVDDQTEHLVIGAGVYAYPHIHRDSVIVGATGLGADNVLSCHESSPVICGGREQAAVVRSNVDPECAELTCLAQ